MSTEREAAMVRTPVDELEPLADCSHYRAASLAMFDAIRSVMALIEEGGRESLHPSRAAFVKASSFLFTAYRYLINSASFAMSIDAALVAMGMGDGRSETQLAAKHGVTKAAFSLEVKKFQSLEGLPPSFAMRTEEAVGSYRKRQLNNKRKTNK